MKYILLLSFLTAFAVVPTRAEEKLPPAAVRPPEFLADDKIQSEVMRNIIALSDVVATDVHVAVAKGVVTLTGVVKSGMAKGKAAEAAKSVAGVLEVKNQLEVL